MESKNSFNFVSAILAAVVALQLSILTANAQTLNPAPTPTAAPPSSTSAPVAAQTSTNSAPSQSPEQTFTAALQSYRAGKYQDAETMLQGLLASHPRSVPILFNLALTEAKLKKLGLALGYLRRVLHEEPTFSLAQHAQSLLKQKIQRPEIPNSVSDWDRFHNSFLARFPTSIFLGFFLLMFVCSGWALLKFWGRRRRAREASESRPNLSAATVVLVFLFLISFVATIAKAYDLTIHRGTVVAAKAEVRVGPGKEATTLFEIPEGNEVVFKDSSPSWVQITYPGGMTGWIDKNSVMPNSYPPNW